MLTSETWRSALVPPPGVGAVPAPARGTVDPVAARVLEGTEPASPVAVTPDSGAAEAVPVETSGRNGSLPEAAAPSDGVTDVCGLIIWGVVVVGAAAATVVAGALTGASSVPPSIGRTTSSPTISRSSATSAATSSSCRGPPAVTCGWVAIDASPHLRARAGRGRRRRRRARRAAGLRQLEHGQDDASGELVRGGCGVRGGLCR